MGCMVVLVDRLMMVILEDCERVFRVISGKSGFTRQQEWTIGMLKLKDWV